MREIKNNSSHANYVTQASNSNLLYYVTQNSAVDTNLIAVMKNRNVVYNKKIVSKKPVDNSEERGTSD